MPVGQIDFGSRHVKKTQGIAGGKRPRLFRIDDIVGNGRDSRRGGRNGANGTEGSDDSHREPSIIVDDREGITGGGWGTRRTARRDRRASRGL